MENALKDLHFLAAFARNKKSTFHLCSWAVRLALAKTLCALWQQRQGLFNLSDYHFLQLSLGNRLNQY